MPAAAALASRLALLVLAAQDVAPVEGRWRAWLDSPGGELPFGLELGPGPSVGGGVGAGRAELVNGAERLPVTLERRDDGTLVLDLAHFDARIEARVVGDGRELFGAWSKLRGPDETARLPFHAQHGLERRFPDLPPDPTGADARALAGRWKVAFASDERPAVALIEHVAADEVRATFLTSTGDYRYLAGSASQGELRLSCFDGAHAFLFHARLADDGTLAGDFWSGDRWHDTWSAARDENARLDDPLALARWDERWSAADFVLPDLDGAPRALADLAGDATLLVLFGSWCPNCHDEARLLADLAARHAPRLAIVGLAFELTGDFERDAEQVRRFARRHGVTWPLLLAGPADKARASQAFPALDAVRAFPTTVFLDRELRARAVHSGYAGPATGAEHAALRAEFEARISALLAEEAPPDPETWALLTRRTWLSRATGRAFEFARDEHGAPLAQARSLADGAAPAEPLAVRQRGLALWIGPELFRLDPAAEVLLSPADFGARIVPYSGVSPLLEARGHRGSAGLVRALSDGEPTVRREALAALGAEPDALQTEPLTARLLELAADPDVAVRTAAAWALGRAADAGALAALEPLLDSPNAALRREAARALQRIAEHGGAPDAAGAAARLQALRERNDPIVHAALTPAQR